MSSRLAWTGSEAEFIAVSSAYEVLSDHGKRREYDEMKMKQPMSTADAPLGPRTKNEAQDQAKKKYTSAWASSSWRRQGQKIKQASESSVIPTQTLDPQEVAKWRYNAGSFMLKTQGQGTDLSSASPLGRYLDRYQREFEGDLRQALRLAYLGPSLHHLGPNQLPKHMEAEERTDLSSPNVLNIVSGRTLLGSISLSPDAPSEETLPDLPTTSNRSDIGLSHHNRGEANLSHPNLSHPRSLFGPTLEPAFDPLRFLEPHNHGAADRASGEIVLKLLEEHKGGSVDPLRSVLGGVRLRRKRFPFEMTSDATSEKERAKEGQQDERSTEDMGTGDTHQTVQETGELKEEVEEEGEAFAVERGPEMPQDDLTFPLISPPPRSWIDSAPSEGSDVLYMILRGKLWAKAVRQNAQHASPTKSRISIHFLHKQPPHDVIGILDDGIYDSSGKRTGHMIRLGLVGVHTIHVFDTSDRGRIKLLCRLTRSQPLPSSLWLFPPREASHSGASWYVEWGGYLREGREGWCDPAVHLLIAAFATLDFEKAKARDGEKLWSKTRMMLGIW